MGVMSGSTKEELEEEEDELEELEEEVVELEELPADVEEDVSAHPPNKTPKTARRGRRRFFLMG